MKLLHTSDWHLGKVLKGQSRLDEQIAVLSGDRRHRRGGSSPTWSSSPATSTTPRRPTAETEKIAVRALSALRRHAAAVVVDRRQPRPRRRAWTRCAPGPTRPASRCGARSARPRITSITGVTAGGEAWRLAALPFVSQRYAVRASEMFELSAAEASATYADHVARLVAALTDGVRRRHRDGQPGHRPPDRGRRQDSAAASATRTPSRPTPCRRRVFPPSDPLRRAGPPAPPPAGARAVPGALLRPPARGRLRRGGEPAVGVHCGAVAPRPRPRSRAVPVAAAVPLRTVRGTPGRAGRAAASTRPRGCGSIVRGAAPGRPHARRCRSCCRGRWRYASTRSRCPSWTPPSRPADAAGALAPRAVRRVPRRHGQSPTRRSATLFNELYDEVQ